MLEVIEIKSIDELKQWKEQWQEDLSIDLSASSAFPANEWFNLNHQKDTLIIVHDNCLLCGAALVRKTTRKLFGLLSIKTIIMGWHFVATRYLRVSISRQPIQQSSTTSKISITDMLT
jgi:hypothetical protein